MLEAKFEIRPNQADFTSSPQATQKRRKGRAQTNQGYLFVLCIYYHLKKKNNQIIEFKKLGSRFSFSLYEMIYYVQTYILCKSFTKSRDLAAANGSLFCVTHSLVLLSKYLVSHSHQNNYQMGTKLSLEKGQKNKIWEN